MSKSKAIKKHEVYWMNELAEVKAAVAPKLQNNEFLRFVKFLLHMGADPYTGEIHPVPFKDKDTGAVTISYIVTRDFRNRVAKSKSNYRRHVARCVYENDDFQEDLINNKIHHIPDRENPGELKGAYCLVWKKGEEIPDYLYRHFEEYRWRTYKGNKSPKSHFWVDMPDTQMEKVPEAQLLKKCWPEAFNNTYDISELPEPNKNGYIEIESEVLDEGSPSFPEGPPSEAESKPEPETKKNEKPPTDEEKEAIMDEIIRKLSQRADEFLYTIKIKCTDDIKSREQFDGIKAALAEFMEKRGI